MINQYKYRLHIHPDMDKAPHKIHVFFFETIEELIAAENTTAQILLTKPESNMFVAFSRGYEEWLAFEMSGIVSVGDEE